MLKSSLHDFSKNARFGPLKPRVDFFPEKNSLMETIDAKAAFPF
jgi:hypothetical protein